MTYSTIQTLSNNPPVDESNFVARDDASLAASLEQQYRDQGLDPALAYDSPEEAFKEFGIT